MIAETLKIGLSTKLALFVGAWRKKRTTYTELRHLDDHILKDIGLSRAEIHRLRRSHWL